MSRRFSLEFFFMFALVVNLNALGGYIDHQEKVDSLYARLKESCLNAIKQNDKKNLDKNLFSYMDLAFYLAGNGMLDDAKSIYLKLVELYPENYCIYTDISFLNFSAAKEILEALIKQNAKDKGAYFFLGRILDEEGLKLKSEENLRKALSLYKAAIDQGSKEPKDYLDYQDLITWFDEKGIEKEEL